VIRNNSPGGGGNDWAIDDIKISHCGPSSLMNYSPEALGCKESPFPVFIRDTIRHIYNNYVYFKWQKSNVGGTVWADMTGPGTSGIGSPVLVNGLYEYVTSLPAFLATAADSGTYYRVVVATSPANLASARCSYKDASTTMIKAITCGIILDAAFIDFSGIVADNKALLTWEATNEQSLVKYEIESSSDAVNFKRIGFEYAKNLPAAAYRFKDPDDLRGTMFYRLKMISKSNSIKYSSVIKLSGAGRFEVSHLVNPFTNLVTANITVPDGGNIRIRLYDGKGKMVKDFAGYVNKGLNKVEVKEPGNLSAGIYFIAVEYRNEVFRTKLIRL
jgi:trimeric autotransporter adhesin